MKKTFLKLLLFLIATTPFIESCRKQDGIAENNREALANPKIENGMLVFKNLSDYDSYLSQMDGGEIGASANLKSSGFRSVRSKFEEAGWDTEKMSPVVRDLYDFGFPSTLANVINEKGEIKVGGYIMWYNKGHKYFIPENQLDELEALKKNPEKIKIKTTAGILATEEGGERGVEIPSQITLPIIGWNLKIREITEVSPYPGLKRYINELSTYSENSTPFVKDYRVFLKIQFQFRNSRGEWRPANGESRNIKVHVSFNNTLLNVGPGSYLPGSPQIGNKDVEFTATGEQHVGLTHFRSTDAYPSYTPYWNCTVQGSIYQHVVGDIQSNEWLLTGYPIW